MKTSPSRSAAVLLAGLVCALAGDRPATAGSRAHYLRNDYALTRRIFALAASGNAQAQARLGFMYEHGLGVPQDYVLAVHWYSCGAEQNDANAQYFLGLMFDKGHGVERSDTLAYKWLNLAASHAPPAVRGYYLQIRDSIASKLTPDQVAEAQWLASSFVTRSAR